MSRLRAWALVVGGLAISVVSLPPGVALVGAVLGGLSSLLAIGLVLAYRAHRFLNLAHASLGAVAGSVVSYLVAHAGWSFWFALPVGLLAGAGIGVVTGALLGERLAEASRTAVVAASLALAFIFGAAHVALGLVTGSVLAFEVPLGIELDVFPVRLSGTHLFAALVVPLALIGVWAFLHRSDQGLRVRALAGAVRHARRLGVDPHATWRVLWLVIGLLAAVAGIASQPLLGTTVERGPLLGPLLLALAAAAVSGMRDLPLTTGAAVALGVAYQAILWRSPVAAAADVALFVVIAVAFAFRRSTTRLDERHDPPHHRLVRSPRPASERLQGRLMLLRAFAAVALLAGAIAILPRLAAGDAQRVGSIGIFVLAGLAVYAVATFRGALSLGLWAIVGIGAFVAASAPGGPIVGVAAAIVAASLASVILAVLAQRGGTLAYAAVTLAAAFAFGAGVNYLPVGAASVDRIGPVRLDDPAGVAVLVIVGCVAVALALGAIRRTRLGRDALALREDPRLAAVHGVRPTVKYAIDAIAGAVAGLAGVLYLWNQRVIHPDAFNAVRSLELVAMTITGGIGSVIGPFLGAALVKGSELFAGGGPLHLFTTGTGLLVIVLWLRGGLVSLVELIRGRITLPSKAATEVTEPPAVVTRFCPTPAAETRKARADTTVRYFSSTVFVLACAGGMALRLIGSDRDPSSRVWVTAIALGFAALVAALAHARPSILVATSAVIGGALVTARWNVGAYVVVAGAAYALGSALQVIGQRVVHALAHASRGWITLQATAGAGLGVAIAHTSGAQPWLIVVACVGILVAASATPRRARSAAPAHQPDEMLTVLDANVTLGGTRVLSGAKLTASAGEIVGIVGANGIGKTTLLRCIAGETPLERGAVFVRHADVTVLTPDERAGLGVMLSDADHGSNGELSVRENLRLAALCAHDRRSVTDVVGLVRQLHPSITERLDDHAAVLSGGERRLLALAQVAIVQPSVLLVDELARGLSAASIETYRALLRAIARRGAAVVVVDHDVAGLTHVADRVLRLHDGRLTPFDTGTSRLASREART